MCVIYFQFLTKKLKIQGNKKEVFSIELTSPELASHMIMSDMKCTRLDLLKETDFVFIRTADGMQKKFTLFRHNFYFLKQ